MKVVQGYMYSQDKLILFFVKQKFKKLFYVIRNPKVLRDPWITCIIYQYLWFYYTVLYMIFEMQVLQKCTINCKNRLSRVI